MSKSKMAKLGEVCEQINGVSYKPNDVSETLLEHYIPVLRAHNIQDDGLNADKLVYVREEIVNPRQIIINDDIIICASSGSKNLVGKAAQSNKSSRVSFGAFCKVIRPKNINGKYLGHFFQTPKYRQIISELSAGANINNLRKEDIASLEIPLPPIEEQKRIADILDKANSLIYLRKQQLEKMNLLIKSKFIDMFGDPVTNPKGWEVKQLSELGCWNSGGTPSRGNLEYFEGDIDWYSAGELNDLFLKKSNERITNEAIKESAAKLFEAGSLLIGMYDTAAFKMGILQKKASSNQACANIKPNKRTNVIWLYFNLLQMKNHFLKNRRGIRQKNLNLGMIKGFCIPVPHIELQNQFAEFVEQVEKQKTVMQESLEKMETNYKALMQEFFG